MSTKSLLFPLVGWLISCGSPETAGGVRTTIDTVGGVIQVRNTGQPPQWSLEPIFRIGSVEGGPAAFGRIRSVLADAAGRVLVADERASEIRVFDSAGAFAEAFGRRGEGPGEFRLLYSLAWLGDTLIVLDPGNARIGLMTPAGSWLGLWRYQPMTGSPITIRLHRASPRDAYARVTRGDTERPAGAAYVRYQAGGAVDTLTLPEESPRRPIPAVVCEGGQRAGIGFYTIAFAPRSLHTFGPDGEVLTAWSAEYRLAFVNRDHDTTRMITREREPVPVRNAEWNALLDEFREWREQWAGAQCEPSGDPPRPVHKPALRHVFFDPEGRMWVEAVTPTGFAFDVYDGDGRLIAQVEAPSRYEEIDPYVRGDRLYLVARDSLEVQYVEAYRVRERGPS